MNRREVKKYPFAAAIIDRIPTEKYQLWPKDDLFAHARFKHEDLIAHSVCGPALKHHARLAGTRTITAYCLPYRQLALVKVVHILSRLSFAPLQ